MGPRRIWKAWRKLRARQNLLGGTVGMSVLVAASAALGQTPGPESHQTTDPPTGGQTPGPQPEAIALPGVQVGAQRARSYLPSNPGLFRLTDNYLDIPQSMTIVTQDLMREQAAFNLRDALRNVTGISLQAGEGGGGAGRQPLAARLPGAHGHLPRRHPRHRPVQPRRLQPGAGRGAEGPLRRLLRPRLDGRRHQPGEQDAAERALLRRHAERRQRAAGPRHHRPQPAARRQHGDPPQRAGPVQRARRARLRRHPALRRGAVVRLGHRHADPGHGELLLLLREQSAGPRHPDRSRSPARSAGRPTWTRRTTTASCSRTTRRCTCTAAPLTFDHKFNDNIALHNITRYQWSSREGAVTPGGILPAAHRRAAAGVDRRHPEPRRARRERVDHRQPDRGPVQVQHVDAQAQARRRRRLRAPDVRPPDDHAHAGPEHVAHQPGPLPSRHLHDDERRAVRGGRHVGRRLRRRRRPDPVVAQVPRGRALRQLRLRHHKLQRQRHRGRRSSAATTSSGRPARRSSCSPRARRRTTSPGAGPSTPPPRRSTRSTSPTRAWTPRRPTRTSSAPSSASSTTRSA